MVSREEEYRQLTVEDFDAIVTGELTHIVIWIEREVENAISAYFVRGIPDVESQFIQHLLRRDGFTFATKLEIFTGMLDLYRCNKETKKEWNEIRAEIEALKDLRNSVVHGFGADQVATSGGHCDKHEISIETTSRSGKSKVTVINPETHAKYIERFDQLIDRTKHFCRTMQERFFGIKFDWTE